MKSKQKHWHLLRYQYIQDRSLPHLKGRGKQLLFQSKYIQPLVGIQNAYRKEALQASQMQILSFVVAITLIAYSLGNRLLVVPSVLTLSWETCRSQISQVHSCIPG